MMFKNLFLKNREIKKRRWIITIFASLFVFELAVGGDKSNDSQCKTILQDQSAAYAKQLIQNSKTRYLQMSASSHSHEFPFVAQLLLARSQRIKSGNFSIVILPRQPDLEKFAKYILGSHANDLPTFVLKINRVQRGMIHDDPIKSLDLIMSSISKLHQEGHPLLIGTQENFRILINALGHGDRSLQPSSKGLLLALNKFTSRVSTLIDFSWEEQAIPQIDRLIHVGLRKWAHMAAIRINVGGRQVLQEKPLPSLTLKKYSAIDDPQRIQDFSDWILATPIDQLENGINNSKNPFGTWFYRFYRMRQDSSGQTKPWWEYFELAVLQKIYDTQKFYLPPTIVSSLQLKSLARQSAELSAGQNTAKQPKSSSPHAPTLEEFEDWVLSLSPQQLEKGDLENDPWFRRWFAKFRQKFSREEANAPAWWNQFKNLETLKRIYQTGQVRIPEEIVEGRGLLQDLQPQENWWFQFRQLERFVLLADKVTLQTRFEDSPHQILRWFAQVLKKSNFEIRKVKSGTLDDHSNDQRSLGWWAYLSDQCIARLVTVANINPPPEVLNYLTQKGFLGGLPIASDDQKEPNSFVLHKFHQESLTPDATTNEAANEIYMFQIASTQEKINIFSKKVRSIPPITLSEQLTLVKNYYRTWFYNLRYRYDGSPSAKGRAWWTMFDDDVLVKIYQIGKVSLPEQELIRLGLEK